MKQLTFLVSLLLPISMVITPKLIASELDNKEKKQLSAGYSYFNIGVENIDYQETPKNISVKSKSSMNNIIIRTGGLYSINQNFNFSIDASATFSPEQTTELWHDTNSGNLLQQNLVTLQNASTLVLLHYKISPSWQILAGGSFNEETFKRFKFEGKSDSVADLSKYTAEESSSHIDINLGVGYGSDLLQNQDDHFSVRAYIGLPLWSETRNTSYPDAIWSDTSSYTVNLQARYSIALNENFHVGVYGGYGFTDRSEEKITNAYNSFLDDILPEATLPTAKTTRLIFGLELLWQL